jgi:dTDP-4-dehydrorhamnose 3,5-epimerase
MHIQVSKKILNKIVFVYSGKILDVVVDLRKKSKNFKKYFYFKMSDKKNSSIYIPKGFAHGYLVLSDQAIVGYITDADYDFKYDTGFHYKSFGFPWKNFIKKNNKKIIKEIVSKRDKNLIKLNNFKYYS